MVNTIHSFLSNILIPFLYSNFKEDKRASYELKHLVRITLPVVKAALPVLRFIVLVDLGILIAPY